MALLVLLAMLTVCAAVRQDLSDKMFTFPQQTDTAHVRVTASKNKMEVVSVCLRFFTDLPRSYSLFSLATRSQDNNFLIWKEGADDLFQLYVMGKFAEFRGLNHKPNTWHSLCATWTSTTGVGQLWLDGKPSSRKFITSGSSIKAPFIIELGQDQDSYGGGFDSKQSFVGMMKDVHMWDYILSKQEIENYDATYVFPPLGNVLNWNDLQYEMFGRVLLEDIQV